VGIFHPSVWFDIRSARKPICSRLWESSCSSVYYWQKFLYQRYVSKSTINSTINTCPYLLRAKLISSK
jgi:hypothetical protein